MLTARTAVVLLAWMTVAAAVRGPIEPGPAETGLLARLRRLALRRPVPQLTPLADRRLAVPPPNLELEVLAGEAARVGLSASNVHGKPPPDDGDDRPLWVRRLDEWGTRPRRRDARVAFDDGWDPPSAGSQPDSR